MKLRSVLFVYVALFLFASVASLAADHDKEPARAVSDSTRPPLPEPMSCPTGYVSYNYFYCLDSRNQRYVIHQGRLFQVVSTPDFDYEIKDPESGYRDLVSLYGISPTTRGGPVAKVGGPFTKKPIFSCPKGYRTDGLKACLDSKNQRFVIYEGKLTPARHNDRGDDLWPFTDKQKFVVNEQLARVTGVNCGGYVHGQNYLFQTQGGGTMTQQCNNGAMYVVSVTAPPAPPAPVYAARPAARRSSSWDYMHSAEYYRDYAVSPEDELIRARKYYYPNDPHGIPPDHWDQSEREGNPSFPY